MAALDARYFGDGDVGGKHVARQLIDTVLKDNPDDGQRIRTTSAHRSTWPVCDG